MGLVTSELMCTPDLLNGIAELCDNRNGFPQTEHHSIRKQRATPKISPPFCTLFMAVECERRRSFSSEMIVASPLVARSAKKGTI